MKYFKLFFFIILLIINSLYTFSQETGSFITEVNTDNGLKILACYVPENYNPSKSYPLIIALQPGGNTPADSMRYMMIESARQCSAVLICPDDQPEYDGKTIQPAIDFALRNYNIEPGNIILTGYSAGGNYTFIYGFENYNKIKGIIGIAPNIPSGLNYRISAQLPIAIIIGENDHLLRNVNRVVAQIEDNNGILKFVLKPGIEHYSGDYFYSDDFTNDWVDCYNFINNIK